MRKRELKRKGGKKSDDDTNGVSDGEKQEEEQHNDDQEEPSSSSEENTEAALENGEQEPKKRRVEKRKTGKQDGEEEEQEEDGAEDANYEVESILDEKKIKGVRHYLIRWKGYTAESDTWEPESTLNCSDLIKEFQSQPKKKQAKKTARKPAGTKKTKKGDDNKQYEVDRILNMNMKKNGKREFLVSWKGYPASQNSWEPEENMQCVDLIKKYLATHKTKEVKGKSPAKTPTKGARSAGRARKSPTKSRGAKKTKGK